MLYHSLKNAGKGINPKNRSEFKAYINNAPDKKYLLVKVILILGTAEAMRSQEIFELKFSNVKDMGGYIEVDVLNTKNEVDRKFVVINTDGILCVAVMKKYIALRPQKRTDPRFQTAYQSGKCSNNAVGYTNVCGIPRIVAKFLGIEVPASYTGHGLLRTSATLLADAGGDLLKLKKHGGWKSSTVAEGYADEGHAAKLDAANKILRPAPSTPLKSRVKRQMSI